MKSRLLKLAIALSVICMALLAANLAVLLNRSNAPSGHTPPATTATQSNRFHYPKVTKTDLKDYGKKTDQDISRGSIVSYLAEQDVIVQRACRLHEYMTVHTGDPQAKQAMTGLELRFNRLNGNGPNLPTKSTYSLASLIKHHCPNSTETYNPYCCTV
jgi:hypothetical protein